MISARWFQDLAKADFLKSVGLYVMPGRLFLVRLQKSLFRLSVVEEEVREIPVGEDADSRRQALSDALRSLLPHFDPSKDPFYICLSPEQTITFQLFLPQVAEDNLMEVLDYEIERHLPFRRGDLYYDSLVSGKKGDKIGLVVFAVPKIVVDEILDTLSTFGIRPKGVESTATALSNYLLFCTREVAGSTLVLGGQDQAWELTGLCARGNGWRKKGPELLFAHRLPKADWIQGPGREIVDSCLRESAKSFGWGYTADLLTSLKIESLELEDLLALGKKRLAGDKGITHSFYLPALGSALRGVREATFQVNLLADAGGERGGRTLRWLNTLLASLLVIGLIGWGASYPIKEEIRLRQLQRESQRLGPSVEALRRKEEELHGLRKEVAFLSGLNAHRGEVLQVLDELSRIVPTTAYLSNLRYKDGAVELQGNAESASNLVPILERSPVFKNVGFNAPSNRSRDNRETFSLKAEIERPETKEPRP